jgi:hypothetical protein
MNSYLTGPTLGKPTIGEYLKEVFKKEVISHFERFKFPHFKTFRAYLAKSIISNFIISQCLPCKQIGSKSSSAI